MTTVVDNNNQPIFVLSNGVVPTNGESSFSGLGEAGAYIIVNVTADPTGASPFLRITAVPVDPSDGETELDSPTISGLEAKGVTLLQVSPYESGAIKVSWEAVTGSWTGVNITLVPNATPQSVQVEQVSFAPWKSMLVDSAQAQVGVPASPLSVTGSVDISSGSVSISGSLPQLPATLGQHARSASLSVTMASDQTVMPVSIEMANSAVTSNQGNPNTVDKAWPIKLCDGSTYVLVTGANALKVDNSFNVQPISDNSGSLTIDSAQLPSSLGQHTSAQSMAVVIASDQSVVSVSDSTNPTFYAQYDRIVPAVNKYMATLFNTSSTRKVVIQRIWAYDWQTSAVSGVVLEQQLLRITARTAGIAVTPVAGDTADSLSTGISSDSGSTAVTDSNLIKRVYVTNEEESVASSQAMPGTAEGVGLQYSRLVGTRGIVLRANQGIAIKNLTNSAVGTVSYVIEFTDEPA